MLKLYDLTTEYKREPLGLDEAQPRFGWKLDSDQQDTVQASYRLQIVQGGGCCMGFRARGERAEYSERVPRSQSCATHRIRLDGYGMGQPRRNRRGYKPV